VTAEYNEYTKNDYLLCWRCHYDVAILEQTGTFENEHARHVLEEDAPCVLCHDVHAPVDPGEKGLVSFEFGIKNGYDIQYIDGRDASTSFWLNGGQTVGFCYLNCHGEEHHPENYHRTDRECEMCHAPPP